jgi:hypothetical protein
LPIPLIENFLFALALLKSRTVENVQEAKTILEGLLHFQNKTDDDAAVKGNFPIYIHHFPACKDYYVGVHIACAIFWILKLFQQVLGQDLKKRLEEALILSVKQALFVFSEKEVPYPLAIKIAVVSLASGQLVGDDQLCDYGGKMLEVLRTNPDEKCWFQPESLGSIAVSLLMVYPLLSEGPWEFFWKHLQSTWHRGTASYAGPSLREWQQAEEPQVTLYDLVCGYFSGKFSDRALKEAPAHLEGALIPHSEARFSPMTYPLELQGVVQGAKWFLHHGEKIAYSYIEKGSLEINQAQEKGFYPFRLIWGDTHRVHSFACQGGNAKTLTFDKTDLIFELGEPIESEDREQNREILFFLDAHEGLEFFVAGQRASTFLLGEEITIRDKELKLSLSFQLEEGEGRFLGHRMLGNRPAQLNAKGGMRFNAYDWQLFLRTISRSAKCRLKVGLKIENDAGYA